MKRFQFIDKSTGGSVKNDLLSGITVALALVPEAVAFAFVAGVSPVVGLYGAFMMGIITAIFGGRPGMISGATGAMAVVMVHLVSEGNALGGSDTAGLQFLFVTLILAGLIQVSAGVLRLGKFVRMIPHSVMMGFVNGLAIVIFLSQLGMFKSQSVWLSGSALFTMIGLVALTMGIMVGLPYLTKKVPAALTAIVVVSLLVIFGNLETETVRSFVLANGGTGIQAGFPSFNVPIIAFTMDNFLFILPYAGILAAIGLIESLMTLNLIDELTDSHGSGNRECAAQGLGNIVNGFFGGMGGCAMIGQSMINVNSGGRGRASGITAALALLGFILFASGLIEIIPLAALVGVMFIVVIGTFEWSSLRIMGKIPKADAFVIILVSGVTVISDLAVAVIVGVIVSALVFAWQHAKHVLVNRYTDENGSTVYEVNGPIFFGAITSFLEQFQPQNDSQDVIVEFKNSRVADHSAIEAIDTLAERYKSRGKTLHLRHLSPECRMLLTKAGDLVEVNYIEDPQYHVATDKLD
ncbi:MAG: SulP family inorganic anion transporter [Flavobacteriaceae bacterium]|nr:SulP family inorganic anion transporter [Flavobacteriaceae bacterium]